MASLMKAVNTVKVKYLGKSKHGFAVNVNGREYKFKPEWRFLEMLVQDADALIATAPGVWEIEPEPEPEMSESYPIEELDDLVENAPRLSRRRKDNPYESD